MVSPKVSEFPLVKRTSILLPLEKTDKSEETIVNVPTSLTTFLSCTSLFPSNCLLIKTIEIGKSFIGSVSHSIVTFLSISILYNSSLFVAQHFFYDLP